MVRYLTPEEVKDVALALEATTEEDLRRHDPATFTAANLYSTRGVWKRADLEPLIEVFIQVRDFFSQAALEGNVMLLSKD